MGRAVVTERDLRVLREDLARVDEFTARQLEDLARQQLEKQREAQQPEERREDDLIEEADRRYADLRRQYESGNLSPDEFKTQVSNEIFVLDSEGGVWTKDPQTGDWYYYDGRTWDQRTPPPVYRESVTVRGVSVSGPGESGNIIVSPSPPVSAPPQTPDDYVDRLLKYIPAESVALYLTLQGIILSGTAEASNLNAWLWFILGVGLIGTAVYQWRVLKIGKVVQLALSTAAFGVWVFALGGAFASLPWYEPFIGSLALVIFTFFAPLISPDVLSADQE
jgi:hypothetical protein